VSVIGPWMSTNVLLVFVQGLAAQPALGISHCECVNHLAPNNLRTGIAPLEPRTFHNIFPSSLTVGECVHLHSPLKFVRASSIPIVLHVPCCGYSLCLPSS
jgi:hypothetical protein